MFGYGENCKLFIKYGDGYIFDDLDNTQDMLAGYAIISINICGSLVYTNEIGTCIPGYIYNYILEHHTSPTITHTIRRGTVNKVVTSEIVTSKIPILMVDKCGRFVSFYNSIADIVKKYPEYNPHAIKDALENAHGKVYGKYWSWDYMYYVRMELRQSGHVV